MYWKMRDGDQGGGRRANSRLRHILRGIAKALPSEGTRQKVAPGCDEAREVPLGLGWGSGPAAAVGGLGHLAPTGTGFLLGVRGWVWPG